MPRGKKSKLTDANLQLSNPDAVYASQAIVAFLNSNDPEGFSLAQLHSDALESADSISVSLLQSSGDDGEHFIYSASGDGKIEMDTIMRDLHYKVPIQRGRKQAEEFYVEKSQIENVKKTVKSQQEALDKQEKAKGSKGKSAPKEKVTRQMTRSRSSIKDKKAESEEEENEDEENEEEDDEDEEEEVAVAVSAKEKPKRQYKRVVGRKKAGVDVEEEEDEEGDDEEKPNLRRSGRKAPSKSEEKKSAAGKKGKKKMEVEDEDEEEEEEDEEQEEEEEEVPKKKVRGASKKAKKEETPKAKKKGGRGKKSQEDEDEEEGDDEEEEEEEKTPKGKQKPAAAASKKGKKKMEVEDEDEEEENEDEDENNEEEEKPEPKKRGRKPKESAEPKKRGRKAKKDEEDDEEEDEEKEEEEKTPKKRGRKPKEDKEVTRATKKKVGEDKIITTKKDDLDGDDEEDEEESGKKKKKKAPAKAKKPPKPKKRPDTYKKGKWNPNVDVTKYHDLLMNPSMDIIKYGSTKTDNKNLMRAVYTKNYPLLEKILKTDYCLSTLHQEWAPENSITALEYAIRNKDVKSVGMLLDAENSHNKRFCYEPPIGLKHVDTGNVSRAAFGVEIRKVNLMRGGREGNNAFTQDLKSGHFDLQSLIELPLTREILDYVRLKQGNPDVFACIDKLVLCGDRHNAGYLVSLANTAGGFGFNFLHEEALTKEKVSELTPNIKKVSVTKKPLGNSGITPLHCAAINPNGEILEALLAISADYFCPDEKMRRLIHYAACCEGPGPLKVLIEAGANATEKDATQLTPLMYAAYYGRAKNVRVLLEEAKVDPLDKTKDGMMAIHWAAQKGYLDVLKVFIEKGVKLAVKGGKAKMTPLHFAAAYNHWDCMEYLIENKAKVLAKDKFKRTPLSVAVRNGNLEIASYLLQQGSDFEQADSSNNYPLHYAAAYGFPECIDILIKAGADVNVQNSWKLTPLTVAMLKNNYHCVKTLLTYPAVDVNAKDDHGRTLVSLLVSNLSIENFDRISFLIKERNCDINTGDINGMTPLHYACQLVASSLVSQADRRSDDRIQKRKSLREAQALKINLVKLLLEYNADVNAKTKNDSKVPLQFAIDNFDAELIEVLIDNDRVDLAFEDGNQNNLYRLLFKHTVNGHHRRLLERVLQRAGNIANILNKEKERPKDQNTNQQQNNYNNYNRGGLFGNNYYGNQYGNRANYDDPNNVDPTTSYESAFTCYKRALLKDSLQTYLDNEKRAVQTRKRNQMVEEENKRVEELRKKREEENAQNAGTNQFGGGGLFGGGGGHYGGGLFGSSYNRYHDDRKQFPEVDRIELTEAEIAQYKEDANRKFDKKVEENLLLLEKFALVGGHITSNEVSQQREDIYNDPRYMIWIFDTFTPDLNVFKDDQNPVIFNIIQRRNKMIYTPTGRKYLMDYVARLGNDHETLKSYSTFKLFSELLFRFGADFNLKNSKGVAPVLYLLRDRDKANPGYLDDIMDYGVDVNNAEDNEGSTPFLEAVYAIDKIIIEKLVVHKVDVNKKDKKGKAPLHYIAEMEKVKALDTANVILHGTGIDVECRDTADARTPLHYAILHSNRGLVNALLKVGADVNCTDKDWSNALYFAAKVGDLSIMRAVGEKIADPNFSGEHGFTPLHNAVANGKIEQVEYLLKIGANPNAKDHKGRSSLMWAVVLEKIEIAKVLLKNGANANDRDDDERTPLHYAVNNSKPEQMYEMEDSLLRNGAQVNALDMYGRTPLFYAFQPIHGNHNFHNQNDPVETVTGLCAAEGINLDIKDRRGRRPLHYAAEHGAYICILLMCKEKITLDEADADGNTPLALALQNGHKDTAAILIQNEAKVTNQIYQTNNLNYLYAHPKDKNWDELEEEYLKEQGEGEVTTMQVEEGQAKTTEGGIEMEIEKLSKKKETDAMEEEENSEEEDDDVTEELDEEDRQEKERELFRTLTPIEATEHAAKPKNAPLIKTGATQVPIDSFFAISIRKGWQGIAYLLLQNGFNMMEAIKDALNEGQFRYVLALMTKIQDAHLRALDSKQQNLFHVFAMKGNQAPSDLTTKIFDGLLLRGVDIKTQDCFGKTPLHYAAANHFHFLEDKLLENGCDPNLKDNNGDTPFSLALRGHRFSVYRLDKYFHHKADLNAKFTTYDQVSSVLHYIAARNNVDLEKKILRLGADPNIEDSQGITPLQKEFIKGGLQLERLKVYHDAKTDFNKVFTVTFTHNKKDIKKTYTLLIYAAEKGWTYLEEELLKYGVDSSIENNDHRTAFEIALSQASSPLTIKRLELYTICRAPVNKRISCKIRRKRMRVTPVLYLMNLKDKPIDSKIVKELLDSGVSVNDADNDGWTAVTYAIRKNWTPLLKLFLSYNNLNRQMRDKQGKTPIHHVVNPMDYASYENEEMLELLAGYFDINAPDERGKAPIYYAHFQDSGTMKNALLALGAKDQKPPAQLQRQATSIIAGVDWLEEVDFETDADKYISDLENAKMDEGTMERMPVDEDAHNRHNLEVVYDNNLGPYSLYMTKVDIGRGGYGEYLFYRMQVLLDKNRDNYILFTKWGRIGDSGMHQETPYPSKDECIAEFCKIFKDKAGNEWKNKANFKKVDKKYRLLNISTRKNQRDYLKPFNWTDKDLPISNLTKPIRDLVKSISDVNSYQQWFGRNHIDETLLPFGKLSKELIFEAKKILLDLREVIEEMEELEEQEREENRQRYSNNYGAQLGGPPEDEAERIRKAAEEQKKAEERTKEIMMEKLKLQERMLDASSRFYELIPDTRFRFKPVAPINNSRVLDEKATMVSDMLDLQVSSKILLGALYNAKVLNPMDYIIEALGIRLLPLQKKQREFKLINQYIQNGFSSYRPDSIVNVFALERRGEAERIAQWKEAKNRTYLWHGSKTINFMGILSQGLRIAPPEAPATGYMFGKGIYFADTFDKSYGYCQNYSHNSRDNTKFILLCEVALGNSLELHNADYITKLDAPYKSVKGCGRQGPDPAYNEVLANGAIVPLGKSIQYKYKNEKGEKIDATLGYNEYIVYDISQVRMRYLIQVMKFSDKFC